MYLAQDSSSGFKKRNWFLLLCTAGWSENNFFEDHVSKAALRYQNTVYEILARSVRFKDPRKMVEVLEML